MKLFSFFLLIAAVFCAYGEIVSEDSDSISYREPGGQVVKLSKNPKRTAIAFASLAQVWYAAGGTAVGIPAVKSKETLPEAARELPAVGGVTAPNAEKLMSLTPDLTLFLYRHERHRAVAGLMRKAGKEAVCVEYNNYSDFFELLDFFCRLNGTTIAENKQAREITAEVTQICASVKDLPGPNVAVIFAKANGFSLENPDTNTGMITAMLGGKNICDKGARTPFSYERLLMDDPEVIVVNTMGEAVALQEKFRREIMENEAWRKLRAARTGRVHFLPPDLFLYLPGARFPEAFRHLAALLYPGREMSR